MIKYLTVTSLGESQQKSVRTIGRYRLELWVYFY
jgi:hypothetical protein